MYIPFYAERKPATALIATHLLTCAVYFFPLH